MDKEATYLLQNLDCNCNECIFMQRDLNRYNESLKLHERWQLDYFEMVKAKLIKKSQEWRKRGEPDKADNLQQQAENMKFQFDKKEVSINYGYCLKFEKSVTFIPGILQLETQSCFKHRKDG